MTLPAPRDVAVVVGRFQVPKFHPGHRRLLDIVSCRHQRVLILLGCPSWKGGNKDPLDYATRAQMFNIEYPTFLTAPIVDCQTNDEWSKKVDSKIKEIFPLEKITMYGGRDGFITHYTGQFETAETVEEAQYSGTLERALASALPRSSEDFRAGVIYAGGNHTEPITMCVDGAVIKEDKDGPSILLVRKPNESGWRFPGGRLDTTDKDLATASAREVREETGVEIGKPVYIGSECGIPDWRATQSGLAIASALFAFPFVYGLANGMDDVSEAQWFKLKDVKPTDMESCHRNFMDMLKKWTESIDYVTVLFGTRENTTCA